MTHSRTLRLGAHHLVRDCGAFPVGNRSHGKGCVRDRRMTRGDGVVDGADLALLLGSWGAAGGNGPADLNADGVVDGADIAVLLGSWA